MVDLYVWGALIYMCAPCLQTAVDHSQWQKVAVDHIHTTENHTLAENLSTQCEENFAS